MTHDSNMIRAFMVRLVDQAGGVEPAAALISAATGKDVSKGSISKRMAGQLEWPLSEILALERALGNPCVSRWVAGGVPEIAEARNIMTVVAEAAREHGEAISAAMAVGMGTGCIAVAKRELQEAALSMQRLAATLANLESGE
jgi:hypothetical protein